MEDDLKCRLPYFLWKTILYVVFHWYHIFPIIGALKHSEGFRIPLRTTTFRHGLSAKDSPCKPPVVCGVRVALGHPEVVGSTLGSPRRLSWKDQDSIKIILSTPAVYPWNLCPGRKDLDSIKRVVSTPAVYPWNLWPGRKDQDSIKRVVSTPAVYPGTCARRGKICK